MTVLSTDPPYSQYTGTGSQTYFEYGFDFTPDTQVIVEVDGVPVTFTSQANGVVLDTAPALGTNIVIFRKTDITQETDFQAYDAFTGAKTEDAMDKLILLKQEAALFRAAMNLTTRQPVEGVWIDNTAGTDAFVQLWDGFSGMFAGEVTTQMPNAGAVVAKPEDFVYFQYGDDGGGGGKQDFDYFIIRDAGDQTLTYFGADLLTGDFIRYGITDEARTSVASDQTFAFTTNTGILNVIQYAWRGHNWAKVMTDTYSGFNGALSSNFIKDFNKLLLVGVEAFGYGLRSVEYATSEPYQLGTELTYPPDGDWAGGWDVRFGNKSTYEYGDALVLMAANGGSTATFKQDGGALVRVDTFSYGSFGNDNQTGHGVNRESGYLCTTQGLASSFYMTQIENDLTITEIGTVGTTTNNIWAVTVTPSGHVMTVEDSGGAQDYVRTYSRDGTTLTFIDEFLLLAGASSAAIFNISHRSDRIWLLSANETIGLVAFQVDDSGNITQDIQIPNLNAYAGSANGQRLQILDGPLNITNNGFTGIKQKLYECWEMNETGSVTRVGAMGNQDLTVSGTVTDRPGTIGNAADFDGVSALVASPVPIEVGTVSNFSVDFDATVDVLPGVGGGNQYFFVRGRNNAGIDLSEFDLGCYVTGAGVVTFFVAVGLTYYTVAHPTPISTATKYHIHVEYDREAGQIGLAVDNSALQQTAVTGQVNLHPGVGGGTLTFGRRTTYLDASEQQYLDGGIDQIFWFMDTLTSDERTWMYNSGNSRAFSEL